MTLSILAFDEKTVSYGCAATTGSLCVGGWVLRGHPESGLSASQGSLPSPMWGDDVLALMRAGKSAQDAVTAVTQADPGRGQRQLAALDPGGGTAHFTGGESIPVAGARTASHVVVTGNLLSSDAVLDACLNTFLESDLSFDRRLIASLKAASQAGGDSRGLLSAALLVVARTAPPLNLRVDLSDDPLAALERLHHAATTDLYADWTGHVPTLDDPSRAAPFNPPTALVRPD